MQKKAKTLILASQLAVISSTALGIALSSSEAIISAAVRHAQSICTGAGCGLIALMVLGVLYAEGGTGVSLIFGVGITATLGMLVAVGAAQMVCDPLARVIMLETQTQRLVPSSLFLLFASSSSSRTMERVSEEFFGCHIDSQFARVGKNSVVMFSAVLLGCFLLLAVQKKEATAYYVYLHVGLFALIVANEDPPWDWRPIYALLVAFAFNAYLALGLLLLQEGSIIKIWIQLPLMIRDAVLLQLQQP